MNQKTSNSEKRISYPVAISASSLLLLLVVSVKYLYLDKKPAAPSVSKGLKLKERVKSNYVREELSKVDPIEVSTASATKLSIEPLDKEGKLLIEGSFKKGDTLEIVIEGRMEDVIGLPAYYHKQNAIAEGDYKTSLKLKKIFAPEGRLKIKVTEPSREIAVKTVIYSTSDHNLLLKQLRQHRKLKSYYIQQEKKKMWQVLTALEENKKISPVNEFSELNKNTIRLGFLRQWQDLADLYSQVYSRRKLASRDGAKDVSIKIAQLKKRISSKDL